MPIQSITSKAIHTLGSKESLIPVMIKDGIDSASLTWYSYKAGGKIEGKDRAVDEFGTQAVWIGGIPFYKKLIDKTAYKYAGINPGVDIRVIRDKEYADWALKNAQGLMPQTAFQTLKNKFSFFSKLKSAEAQSVYDALSGSLKNGGKTAENLYKNKVFASTALTLITFFLLTKGKQSGTKKSVKDEFYKKMHNKAGVFTGNPKKKNNNIFAGMENFASRSSNTPAFKGGLKSVYEAVLFNPVHNMQVIDAGITAERLGCSRNKTEFGEHAIKEGSFLFFLYKFGGILENAVNKLSVNLFKKPVDVEIDVLTDESFSKALENNKAASDAALYPVSGTLSEKLNFISSNPENTLVIAAKKSKIISETKDKSGRICIDTSKYIDTESMDDLAGKLKDIQESFLNSGESIKKYMNKSKALKITAVMTNMIISCIFFAYVIPKMVYKFRKAKTGTLDFHAANDIIKEEQKKAGKNKTA